MSRVNSVFISSTYKDLDHHRRAIAEILTRMKRHFSAMEFFGSRTDQALPVCKAEIDDCAIFIGIYAWRYGWTPPGETRSITELEFDFARTLNKPTLCYVVKEEHPWPPTLMDSAQKHEALLLFKKKVSKLVRSTFSTPDNLAKQVAADIAREFANPRADNTVGGLLQINWDRLAPDLQLVILDAYKRAKQAKSEGVVSTRHVIAAMEALPNSSGMFFRSMPEHVIN